jgi:hypothetical protein
MVRATVAAAIAGTLATAVPSARAQSSMEEHRMSRRDDGRTFTLSVRGKVWFTDDDRDVQRIESGGRVLIEEKIRGGPERMLVLMPSGDGVQRTYLLDGRPHEYDADARTWLASVLPEIVRESGAGAVERARRIFSQRGADGVLDEIELIHSSSTRRIYITTLIAENRLSPPDAARALRAAGAISSSSEKASVLVSAADRLQLSDGTVRGAYLDAARTISSGSELRRVLIKLLETNNIGDDAVAGTLRTSAEISSSSERASVLVRAAERHKLSTSDLRAAFFSSADGISSSSERRRVLVALLRAQGTDREVVKEVVRSARGISSDSEKAAVLMEVPSLTLRDTSTADAYRETMSTINSRSSRAAVAAKLGTPD